MTKLKSLKFKYYAVLALALIIGVGSYLGVKAFSGGAQNVAEAGGTINVVNNVSQPDLGFVSEEPFLGAVTGPNLPNPYLVNDQLTYIAVQTAADASLVPFSIIPPESFQKATSTGEGAVAVRTVGGLDYTTNTTAVDFVEVYQSGVATTTIVYSCGASASATAAPTLVLLTGTVNTSTGGYFENNLTNALGGRVDGGTIAKINLTPQYPYFVCTLTEQVAGGVTNSANTYVAKIKVRMSRTR